MTENENLKQEVLAAVGATIEVHLGNCADRFGKLESSDREHYKRLREVELDMRTLNTEVPNIVEKLDGLKTDSAVQAKTLDDKLGALKSWIMGLAASVALALMGALITLLSKIMMAAN